MLRWISLQDHTYFSVYVKAEAEISYSSLYHDISKEQQAAQEFQSSQGPFTAPIGLSFGFEKIPASTLSEIGASSLAQDQAHVEYFYESIYYPNLPNPYYLPTEYNTSYVSLTAGLIAPVSRGSVSVLTNSITNAPQIDLNYYSAPEDQAVAIYAFKNLRKILAEFATYNYTIGPNNGEVAPGPSVESDAEILDYIRSTAYTVSHASGTCAMLPQENGGVVNEKLQVYGVEGLRIVDASIFPRIPDQHTQGPTYMVAEKAATIILQDSGY
jgi:choline dehydrogenase-like flavoprotein